MASAVSLCGLIQHNGLNHRIQFWAPNAIIIWHTNTINPPFALSIDQHSRESSFQECLGGLESVKVTKFPGPVPLSESPAWLRCISSTFAVNAIIWSFISFNKVMVEVTVSYPDMAEKLRFVNETIQYEHVLLTV